MEDMMITSMIDNTSVATATEGWRFDDVPQRRLVAGLLVFIGLAGLVGNAVVIIAFVLSEKLQNITNIFVINLAVSDFLSCLLVPFFIQNVLTDNPTLLPEPVCAMVGILLYVFVSSSIVNHAVIAGNRYYGISRPDSVYRKMFSPVRIVIIVVFIWTYSSIIPLVTHLSNITKFGFNSKYRICSLDVIQPNAQLVSYVRTLAVDFICLIIVIIFYVKFFLFIKRNSNRLMHIYSYDRQRGSENRSSAGSTLNRGSDVSQVTGMTRQTSTLTRIVDLDHPNGVETVLSKPGLRRAWRPVGRSVSQTIITPTDAFNGHITEDVIREENEMDFTEEAEDGIVNPGTDNIENKREPDSSERISEASEVLSAIDESAEYASEEETGKDDSNDAVNGSRADEKDSECIDALGAVGERAEHTGSERRSEGKYNFPGEICENGEHAREDGVLEDTEHRNSISESYEEVGQTYPRYSINGDVGPPGSTENSAAVRDSSDDDGAFHGEDSSTSDDLSGAKYHQGGNSPSEGSPTHSVIANQRRRFSALAKRSFFGRSVSVSSQSERVRNMQVRLNKRQVQITKNLFVVVCAFVFCISQYAVFLITPSLERLLPYSAVLITGSHAINPIIYAMKHPTFKVVIRPMLMCKLSKIPGPSRVLKALLGK